MTNAEWAESFTIFAKYQAISEVGAEHDEVWAGPDPSIISDNDKARLEELGWRVYDNDFGFHHFV